MVSGRFSSRSPKSQVVTVTLALGQKTPGGQGSILSGAGHTFPALHRPCDSGHTPSEIATRLAACALGLLLKARASFLAYKHMCIAGLADLQGLALLEYFKGLGSRLTPGWVICAAVY